MSSNTFTTATSRDFLGRVAPVIRQGGARNIVELAKALKMPVETTRYKVKGMLKKGIGIHASIDYSRLGLTHYYAYLSLSEKARMNEKKFFGFLGEQAYLNSYARSLPSNEYACRFAVPTLGQKVSGSLRRMLRGLAEEKLVDRVELHEVTWEKAHMLQPEYFDLKRGIWRIDWSKIKKEALPKESAPSRPSIHGDAPKFDTVDLLIARELEVEALTRLSDIASSLRTTLNNVFYHFHNHVIAEGLVEEFVLRWDGASKQQKAMLVQIEFSNLSVAEEKVARGTMRKLPFLWSDALSIESGFYVAQTMMPQDSYLDTMNYLSGSLADSAFKCKASVLDAKTRQDYPFPAHLFKDGTWSFDLEENIQQIAKLTRR